MHNYVHSLYIHCILRICIQFAVVVDDYLMGITEVVRGQDLLMSTARQLLLYEAMGYTPPLSFYHCPLLRDDEGRRLAVRITNIFNIPIHIAAVYISTYCTDLVYSTYTNYTFIHTLIHLLTHRSGRLLSLYVL